MRSLAPRRPRLVRWSCARASLAVILAAEQNSKAWIGLDNDVQLVPWEGENAHHRKATSRVIHRRVRCRLKPEHGARQCKIQDLAGAVIEQRGEGNPAVQNNEIVGTDITLTIEIRSGGDDPSTGFQIGDRREFFSYRHLVSPVHCRASPDTGLKLRVSRNPARLTPSAA